MKKLFALFLALLSLFPSITLADTSDDLIGSWAGVREAERGKVDLFFVRFYDDGTALYDPHWFDLPDKEEYYLVNVGLWELKDDGVHIYYTGLFTGEDADLHLELTADHQLGIKLATSYILLSKLPDVQKKLKVHTVKNWD